MSSAERIFGTVNNGEVEFVNYKPEYLDGVKHVLNTGFYPGECIANGCHLQLPENAEAREDITQYCVDVLAEGISIVARDAKTKQIVGHVMNELVAEDKSGATSPLEIFVNEKCRSTVSKTYVRINMQIEETVDMFAANETDVVMAIMFLGVHPDYTQRSIGLRLVEYSLQLAAELKAGQHLESLTPHKRQLAARLGAATATYASNYSKSIGDKLGFRVHGEVFYADIECNGGLLQDNIPNPLQRSAKLMSKRV